MLRTKIEIINKSSHPMPTYMTTGAAGMDIYAFLPETITLAPRVPTLVPTGLYMAIPQGMEAQVRPRSGLAAKHGIIVPNAPGTIDSDYRGEIRVPLMNLTDKPFEIKDGERIAQLLIAPYITVTWEQVEKLPETVRGEGGFGSTNNVGD